MNDELWILLTGEEFVDYFCECRRPALDYKSSQEGSRQY